MGRPRRHKDNASKVRHSRLNRRARALRESFFGLCLIQIYQAQGQDPDAVLRLPWINWDTFAQAAGETDIRKIADLELPFVEFDRTEIGKPKIRIGSKTPTKKETPLV